MTVKVLADGTRMVAFPSLPKVPRPITRANRHLSAQAMPAVDCNGEELPHSVALGRAASVGRRRAVLLPAGLPEVTPAYVALVTRQRPDVTYIPRRTDVVTPLNAVRGPNTALSTGRAVAA